MRKWKIKTFKNYIMNVKLYSICACGCVWYWRVVVGRKLTNYPQNYLFALTANGSSTI